MLRKYTFVGMVDIHLSLLQFNTKLVLVNHTALRLVAAAALPLLPLLWRCRHNFSGWCCCSCWCDCCLKNAMQFFLVMW